MLGPGYPFAHSLQGHEKAPKGASFGLHVNL